MTDFPTVGLGVDLSGIDAGDAAYDRLQKRIEGVGTAAETTAKKVTASTAAVKAGADGAAQAAAAGAAATTKAAADETKATAAAAKQQEAQRVYLQGVRIRSIQMEDAARRAAQAAEAADATRQANILIAADRAATAQQEANRKYLQQVRLNSLKMEEAAAVAAAKAAVAADAAAAAEQAKTAAYLLQVRLNSFKMQETAAQKAALAQIKSDNDAAAAAVIAAERRAAAAAAAAAAPAPRVAGAPSSTEQMAEQIKAQEAAYIAEAAASKAATTERDLATVSMTRAAAAAAPVVTGLDAVALSMAKSMSISVDEARAILNVTKGYEGMFPALNGVSTATDEYAGRVEKLRAALVPGAAAQQLLSARTAEANALQQAGAISQAERTALVAAATKEFNAMSQAIGGTSIKTRESIVLFREFLRGDFSRMAGSTTILFNAFSKITAELLSMVAVIAAVAAPFIILGVAALKGEEEVSKFNGALIATGNYAGLTEGSLEAMASSIAKSSDTTISSTKAVAESLAESGKFSAASIASLTDAAENYSRITHENATKFATEYEGMKDNLVKFAVKHEDVYHDLTLAQVEQIALLVKHGQEQEAQEALSADIDAASKKRRAEATAEQIEQFGTLQRLAHELILLGSDMWDALMGVGRPATNPEKLVQAMDKLSSDSMRAQIARQSPLGSTAAAKAIQDAALAKDLAAVNAASKAVNDENDKAAAKAAQTKKDHDAIQAKFGDGKTGRTKADPTAERLQALDAEAQGNRILASTTDLTTAAGVKALAMQKALIDAAKTSRAGTDLNTQAQKLYGAELAVVVTAAAKQAETDVANTNAKSKATEQATALIQQLGVSQGVANQMVADSNELAKLQADYDAAGAKDKPRLAKAIADTAAAQERKNKADQAQFLAVSHQSATDQLAQLALEAKLIGATNVARAVAVAQLKEEQALALNNVKPTLADGSSNPDYEKAIDDAKRNAAAQSDLTVAQNAYNDSLGHTLEMLTQIASHTQLVGQGLSDAFGKGGASIAALANASTALAVQLETIRKKEAADIKALAVSATASDDEKAKSAQRVAEVQQEASAASANAQLTHDAAVIESFKSLFGQQTAAYKILQTIQQVYYAEQFAMQAKAIAIDVINTVKWIANSGARAAANGLEAIAKAMASLPFPLNLAAAAATAAALIGFGIAVSGAGGGGGNVSGANDEANRQKAQGAGSVLGDAVAKSDSIAKSIAAVEANTNKSLEFSNGMLTALKSIDSNIGSLTSLLARQLQVGSGLFDTSKLGLGSSTSGPGLLKTLIAGPLALLLPGLFGSKSTTTLQDQGLQFTPATLASILSNGISGNTFAQTSTETQSKFLGITLSDKTKVNTTTGALDADVQSQLTAVIDSLRSGVLAAAGVLGVTGAQAALDAMTVDLGKISFKDMTGDQIQQALNAVFGKLGDQMATIALPMITSLQKVGEGAFETLTRVARDYQLVDISLSEIGRTFGAVGVASLAAREHLIDLAGGIDTLTSQVSDYASKFLTPQEQILPVITAVYTELGKLGAGSITTKDQFKALVNSLDLTTDSGAQAFATLMKIAPAFSDIVDYTTGLTAANDNVTKAQSNLNDAYNAAAGVIQTAHDKFAAFVTSLKAFRSTLDVGAVAQNSPQDQYLKTKAIFEDTAAKAASGNEQALGDLQSVSTDYLNASKDYFAATEPYFQDLAAVKAATDAATGYAQSQVDIADQQLAALNAQTSGLLTINSSVLSVVDAIKALQTAQSDQAAAVAAAQAAAQSAANAATAPVPAGSTPSAPSPGPATVASSGSIDYNQLLKDRPDVLAEYNRLIAIADKNSPWYAQHGLDKGAVGFAQWWYTQGGGSASYSQSVATAQSLDVATSSSAGIATGTPMPTSMPPATAPSVGMDPASQALADALNSVSTQIQISNAIAQEGHTQTVTKLGDVEEAVLDVKTQIRAQAA